MYSGKRIISWMCTSQCCISVCHMSCWIGSGRPSYMHLVELSCLYCIYFLDSQNALTQLPHSGKHVIAWPIKCQHPVLFMGPFFNVSDLLAFLSFRCEYVIMLFPRMRQPDAFWETRCISANQVSIPTVLLMGPIFNVSDLLAFLSFRCEYVIMLFPRMRQPVILTMAILSHLFCRFCQETNCCQCALFS